MAAGTSLAEYTSLVRGTPRSTRCGHILIGTIDINHSSSIVALLDYLGHDITPFETKTLK